MLLRPGTRGNVPALANLHAQCFAAAWDETFLSALLGQQGVFGVLALIGDDPVGFAIARAVAGEAEILSLGVATRFRQCGIGAALARALAERAWQEGALAVYLEVSAGNEAARALYEHLGFCEIGRRPGYYPDALGAARDALVLRRALPL